MTKKKWTDGLRVRSDLLLRLKFQQTKRSTIYYTYINILTAYIQFNYTQTDMNTSINIIKLYIYASVDVSSNTDCLIQINILDNININSPNKLKWEDFLAIVSFCFCCTL